MSEIIRSSGNSDWIDLELTEPERTPERAIVLKTQFDIQSHVSGLSVSKPWYLSLTARTTSKLNYNKSNFEFSSVPTVIGTLSNGFFER